MSHLIVINNQLTEWAYKVVPITIIVFTLPLFQTIVLSWLSFTHPAIRRNAGHTWEGTKEKYRQLCIMMKKAFPVEKDWKHVMKWLEIKEINVMQYQSQDQDESKWPIEEQRRKDGRLAKMRKCGDEFSSILQEVNISKDTTRSAETCTEMMRIINHHIAIMLWIERFIQINYGMFVSRRTEGGSSSMEWRGVVAEVTKLEPGLKFPQALRYNVIRSLSNDINNTWDHSAKGTEFDAHSMLIAPWPTLQTNAKGYIKSFLFDTWTFYLQVYVACILLVIIFS